MPLVTRMETFAQNRLGLILQIQAKLSYVTFITQKRFSKKMVSSQMCSEGIALKETFTSVQLALTNLKKFVHKTIYKAPFSC